MKKFFLFFVILFFCSGFVAAQTIQTDKDIYEKGETISVTVFSQNNEKIQISNGAIILFEGEVIPTEGVFFVEYIIDFLDPLGGWKIRVGSEEKKVQVNSPRSGLFYLINFFSPSTGEHERGKLVKINVEVTDAQNPVILGKVLAFGVFGEKIELIHKGGGKYEADYVIPFNAPLGEWNLMVTAKTGSFSETRGGENKISLSVRETPILLEVIQPSVTIVGLGEKTNLIVKANYASGLEVSDTARISALVNGQVIELQRKVGGEFFGEFTPKESGEISIEFEAIDSAQNTGNKKITVIVGGFFDFFVQNLWAPALLLVLVVFSFLYLTKGKVEKSMKKKSLEKQLEELKIQIRQLDENYFKKRVINRESYNSASTELRVKKAEVEEKIRQLGEKKKLKTTNPN